MSIQLSPVWDYNGGELYIKIGTTVNLISKEFGHVLVLIHVIK